MKNIGKKLAPVFIFSTSICLLLSLPALLFAQMGIQKEYLVKAAFIYNFTRYIEWDIPEDNSAFVICVLGSSEIVEPLKRLADVKTVEGRKIDLVQLSDIIDLKGGQILFIPNESKNQLSEALKSLENTKNHQILLVTESKGSAKKGSAINFVKVDNKVRFELNDLALERAGLEVSSRLLNISILVKGE